MRSKLVALLVFTRPGLCWISFVGSDCSSHHHHREEAEAQVSGYSGANHRRFSDLRSAVDWVGIPIGQLASWVQGALSNDLHRQGMR